MRSMQLTVTLTHKADFEAILRNYAPSETSRSVLASIPLTILLGVSGAGRNTIINHLVNSGNYHFIVSDTTRPPKLRDGHLEQDGVQYNFRSEEEILAGLKAGEYLEAELIHDQQVSGISIRELQKAAASNKVPINEVDVGGTKAIYLAKPDTVFFFIIPPTYNEWMYRLKGREVMSEGELENRLHTALNVLREGLANPNFHFVVNDSSNASAHHIDQVVRHGHKDEQADSVARHTAHKILQALE